MLGESGSRSELLPSRFIYHKKSRCPAAKAESLKQQRLELKIVEMAPKQTNRSSLFGMKTNDAIGKVSAETANAVTITFYLPNSKKPSNNRASFDSTVITQAMLSVV
jgi:hypothetical protein